MDAIAQNKNEKSTDSHQPKSVEKVDVDMHCQMYDDEKTESSKKDLPRRSHINLPERALS